MSNSPLLLLQSQIGQTMSKSPSPVGRWLNGKLLDITEGKMIVEYLIREDMTNPMGILHGGIAAAMMDEVLGILVYSVGNGSFYTTVNLNVDYLSSGKLGEVVTAEANIIRKGRNIVHAECRMTNAEGKLLSKATSNLLELAPKNPNP